MWEICHLEPEAGQVASSDVLKHYHSQCFLKSSAGCQTATFRPMFWKESGCFAKEVDVCSVSSQGRGMQPSCQK